MLLSASSLPLFLLQLRGKPNAGEYMKRASGVKHDRGVSFEENGPTIDISV
ncbi:MAG TPA: hypothetical protein VKL99_15570 [Candidatus Angelobacter sp.]|nr:hypothetical protein [Candidatus Angelobacter sp.]